MDNPNTNYIDAGLVSFDMEGKKIFFQDTLRKKNYKLIDFSDVTSIQEIYDGKTHVRPGNGSALKGAIIGGLLIGNVGGARLGAELGRGTEKYVGFSRLRVCYSYQGKIHKYYIDNSLKPREFAIFYQCISQVGEIRQVKKWED